MPIETQLRSNRMQIKIQLNANCDPIEGNTQGADLLRWVPHSPIIPICCQFSSISIHWQRFRIVRVPPLKIFRESSRPIGSQHSELSTNERPRFRQDSGLLPNFEPSNALPIGFFSISGQMGFVSTANGMPIYHQWKANWLPIKCQFQLHWEEWEWNQSVNLIPLPPYKTFNPNRLTVNWVEWEWNESVNLIPLPPYKTSSLIV